MKPLPLYLTDSSLYAMQLYQKESFIALDILPSFLHVKFIYSEKATIFCEISTADLTYVVSRNAQIYGGDFAKFRGLLRIYELYVMQFFRQVRATAPQALIYVDAVHYAPHMAIDVQDLDCDFCVCSTFKFFGPHCGMLFGKSNLMRTLRYF